MSGDSRFVARWGDGPDVVLLHGLIDVDCHLGALMPQLRRRAVAVAHSTGAIRRAVVLVVAAAHPFGHFTISPPA